MYRKSWQRVLGTCGIAEKYSTSCFENPYLYVTENPAKILVVVLSSKVGGYSITGNRGLSLGREEAGTNPPKLGNHPLNKLSVK